ncbi:E3 ubiquitin-protein ligase RAD18-like [Parasteatoda tepidariorum]|uniref:E3 ubiquitin-protein ligase RAD18-like n=1 Tax=Parasteatoda tepidariorum TaxID=114398 RepID=UPI0039BCF0CD
MAAAQCIEPSTSCLNTFSEDNIVLNYKMLKPLDDALRCRICDDYFNSCMMTKCNHNYCSVCIRRYMTYKSQCPTCFQDAAEPELQNNRLVDEILRLYKKFRGVDDEKARVLKTSDLPACSPYVKESSSDSQSTSSMLSQSTSTSTDEPFTPRVKIEIPDDKGALTDSMHISIKKEPDFDEVTCPVCYNAVLGLTINAHLDSCLKQQFDDGRRKTLPKLVYHLLTDKEIKMRLREHKLPVNGDRQALIRRHKNFITLYNANCDALNPKPVSELVKEIELQELEERINSLPKEIQVHKKSDLSLIEQQHQSYIKKHQSQFNSLINDVHQRHIGQVHVKKEIEDSVFINHEYVPDKTISDHDTIGPIKIEDHSSSGTGNSKEIDIIDASSLDDFDISKRTVNHHHKRKKASLGNQNQSSPKKK